MNPSDPCWREVRDSQDRARKQAGYLARARISRLAASAAPARWRRWSGLALAAAIAAVVVGSIVARHSAPRDLRFWADGETGEVGSWVAAPDASTLALRFSDGTLFRLSPGSRARVGAVDPNGARVIVERGRVSAAVVHRAASHWLIDVGPFEVLVVGTRFDVSWDPSDEEFVLQLQEGAVVVSGACVHNPTPVGQGHALRVTCQRDREEIVETLGEARTSHMDSASEGAPAASGPQGLPSPAAADAGTFETAARANESARPSAAAAARTGNILRSPAWRSLISAGRFREALDLVEQSGFDETCRRASGTDLLELGDAERLAGETSRTRQAYLAARGKLPQRRPQRL